MRNSLAIVLCCTCLLGGMAAHGQTYPNRTVRIIVAFPPGGGTDIVARIVGARLTEI
ncbi:MAG TPA: hypothetical protein VLN59_05315 [Burkholderiales bacterium]|nr:hypothetical protein [Burkholderiales bacterium]